MPDYPTLALELYKLARDPLVLDSIRVLTNPDDPMYEVAKGMIDAMEEARQLLKPVE